MLICLGVCFCVFGGVRSCLKRRRQIVQWEEVRKMEGFTYVAEYHVMNRPIMIFFMLWPVRLERPRVVHVIK